MYTITIVSELEKYRVYTMLLHVLRSVLFWSYLGPIFMLESINVYYYVCYVTCV